MVNEPFGERFRPVEPAVIGGKGSHTWARPKRHIPRSSASNWIAGNPGRFSTESKTGPFSRRTTGSSWPWRRPSSASRMRWKKRPPPSRDSSSTFSAHRPRRRKMSSINPRAKRPGEKPPRAKPRPGKSLAPKGMVETAPRATWGRARGRQASRAQIGRPLPGL